MKKHHNHRISFFATFLLYLCFTGNPGPGSSVAQTGPTLGGCPVFPPDNIWNAPIDRLPLDPNSSAYIETIGPSIGVHPDFGSGLWNGGPIGIPYNIVSGIQPKVPITFDYSSESDSGPYPIPPNAAIEGGSQSSGDRHILVLDKDNCILYETWSTYPQLDGSWTAGSGAIFDLRSNALRPSGWTSADAAGLPILPGLVRYDEVASGEIRHALRFTAPQTRRAFIWPARHYASSLTSPNYPPMGQRFRLKADVDISGFSPEVQVILRAMKKYGMILADNGSAWYISGVPDSRWNNDALVNELKLITGSHFEAVDETSLMVNMDSGQVPLAAASSQAILIDHTCTDISKIPDYWLTKAKELTLHYAHTSHGSQINSGILALEQENPKYSVAIRTDASTPGLPSEQGTLRIYDGNPPETYITPGDYWSTADGIARTQAVAIPGCSIFPCGRGAESSHRIRQPLSSNISIQ